MATKVPMATNVPMATKSPMTTKVPMATKRSKRLIQIYRMNKMSYSRFFASYVIWPWACFGLDFILSWFFLDTIVQVFIHPFFQIRSRS